LVQDLVETLPEERLDDVAQDPVTRERVVLVPRSRFPLERPRGELGAAGFDVVPDERIQERLREAAGMGQDVLERHPLLAEPRDEVANGLIE
jgi:hypothetical protein